MEIAVKSTTEADWKLHLKSKLVWDSAYEYGSLLRNQSSLLIQI